MCDYVTCAVPLQVYVFLAVVLNVLVLALFLPRVVDVESEPWASLTITCSIAALLTAPFCGPAILLAVFTYKKKFRAKKMPDETPVPGKNVTGSRPTSDTENEDMDDRPAPGPGPGEKVDSFGFA